jgi:hypothetical protein
MHDNNLTKKWIPGAIENDVLFGRKEHLFLAHGMHRVLDIVTGKISVPAQSFKHFHSNILFRAEIANKINAKYLHVIFPDKQSVIDDEYPFESPTSLGSLYAEECSDLSSVMLFPLNNLRGKNGVFKCTDTHLTDFGTLTVAGPIVDAVSGKDNSKLLHDLVGCIDQQIEHAGDLGGRFKPPITSVEHFFSADQKVIWLHNNIYSANNGIVDIRIAPNAPYKERLLFFGDSFGRDCVRFLSFFFEETLFIRSGFFHEEVALLFQPDILITENVERYLDNCRSDDERGCFFMYPYFNDFSYQPSKEFAEAFSALLSYPRPPYSEFRRKVMLKLSVDE